MHVEPGVRLPPELHRALRLLADKHHRSLNAEILVALEEYVTAYLNSARSDRGPTGGSLTAAGINVQGNSYKHGL